MLIFFYGCDQQRKEVSFYGNNGLYLCVEQSSNNIIKVNRKVIGDWEKFSINYRSANKISIRTSNFLFISSDKFQNGLLGARKNTVEKNAIFKKIDVGENSFVLKDYRDKFIKIDTNQVLKASGDNIEDAFLFNIYQSPQKTFTYFTLNQLIPLIIGLVLVFISLITFQVKVNKRISLTTLVFGAFFLRLFVSLLIPYLNLWDEQIHALVAKNMMTNPFQPMLYENALLPYDFKNWTANHIWLHKQPLFLWQMAMSMKLFGVNLFALRLPSLIMSSFVVVFIYRIGKLSVNQTTGYIAALLYTLSNFSLELTAGSYPTDHNDVAFLFYVSASIWAWVEYELSTSKRKRYFLILIGIFSGCAVLVKWLTGLLIFSGWGLSIIMLKERRKNWVHYRNLLVSFFISLFVFLPWQIYIFYTFPKISNYEFTFNARHFFEVLEGHGGDYLWHLNATNEIYGVGFLLILLALVILFRLIKNKILKISLFSYIIIIYLFFTIAATKMIAFTYCISVLIFIALAVIIERFLNVLILNPVYFTKKKYTIIYTTIVLSIISILNLNIEKIQENHTMWKKDENSFFEQRIRTTNFIKSLSNRLENSKEYVIFNSGEFNEVPLMFFNNIKAAYSVIPTVEIIQRLKKRGCKIVVFENGELPEYILKDETIIKIPALQIKK